MILTSNKEKQQNDNNNSTVRSTQISFFIQLQKSNKKAKELLHRNFTKQLKNGKAKIFKYDKLSNQKTDRSLKDKSQNLNKTDHCINTLREQINQEQFKEQLLKNRILYYDNEKQRCIKTVKQAKRRYSTIMQNRNQTLKMKKSLNQDMLSIQNQHKQYITSLQKKATLQKKEKTRTLQLWKSRKLSEASLVKDLKDSCHRKISHQKSIDMFQKRQMAKTIKAQEQVLYKKTLKAQEQKKKVASLNHSSKIFEQIQKKKYIIKKNKRLMNKVINKQNEIKKIVQKANKQIEMYEAMFKFKLFKKRNILKDNSLSDSKNKLFITKF